MSPSLPDAARKRLEVARLVARERGPINAVLYLVGSYVEPLTARLRELRWIVQSRLTRAPLVHVMGDSHSKTFRGHRGFVVHHLGAATAHNLKKEGSTTGSNEKLFRIINRLPQGANALLIFGEIDCRIHAYYQFRKNNEQQAISDILDMTVRNYGEVLEKIRARGIDPCVLSVAPATTVGNEYNFPYYASPEVRSQITRVFNDKLREFCEGTGFTYIDIYPLVSDENGMRLDDYADDEIHLNGKAVELVRAQLRDKRGLAL